MNIKMLGYNISNEMAKKDVSFRMLGEWVGMSHATVANHVRDPKRITLYELLRIAAALGVDWMDLIEGVE